MKPIAPIAWMTGSSLASWLLITFTGGSALNPELLFGMAGPLTSATATWVAIERTHASAPEAVMRVLIAGFAVKMVLFAAYVIVMIGVLAVRPVPFVAGFAGYFIALHLMEAMFLQRLLATSR